MQHPTTRTQAQDDARREVERTMGRPWSPETHDRNGAYFADLPPLRPGATDAERELRGLQEQARAGVGRFARDSGGTDARAAADDSAVREQARREWAASAALRDEFVTEDAYLAFKAAEAKGRFKALNAQPGVYRGRA